MPRPNILRWLIGAWLVLAAPAGRHAAAAPRGDAPPRESARSYYEKATSAFGLGDYDKAAEFYEKAFQLRADAALLYDAAQAHRMAGHKDRALQLYKNYVRLFPDTKQVPDARRHIEELQGGTPAPAAAAGPALVPVAPAPGGPAPAAAPPSNLVLTPAPPPPTAGATAPGGDLTRSASPPEAADGHKRRSTWIWIAVGGAAVVAGAITTAVLLGGSTHDPTPSLGAVGGATNP